MVRHIELGDNKLRKFYIRARRINAKASMRTSLIVAMANNGVIGVNGDLPWRLSADLRRFKQLTMGHSIIMGRKTYESIGRLLPGRTTIVVTRQKTYSVMPGALLAHSVPDAVELARGSSEAFIIGGAEIYRVALPLVDRMYVTAVAAEVAGDTYFPDWDPTEWRQIEQTDHAAEQQNGFDYSFRVYDRQVGSD
jgi:dihydrofolate reductase